MIRDNYKLEHAHHNEKAFNFLSQKKDFLDWVVTIAFYSALNYVKYKIFPLIIETDKNATTNTIKDFEVYAKSYNKYPSHRISKHELLLNLVQEKCPAIYSQYRQLKEMSSTARYIHYQTDRDLSNYAKKLHKDIKDYCDDTTPKP